MTHYTRTVKTPDTFGMSSSVARRTKARANGTLEAETGRHAGGPCPAVCLATLTGWTYARAEAHLRRHGFRGDGMSLPVIRRAYTEVLGDGTAHRVYGTVEATAARLPRSFNGAIVCRGHIMPIRNGRLLNASRKHRAKQCECLIEYHIIEETI